ncbi:MAG: hypothetical protein JWP35_1867 [Caulobacter sp.]|nr:hypothetical protein [Caulobacter sp.]
MAGLDKAFWDRFWRGIAMARGLIALGLVALGVVAAAATGLPRSPSRADVLATRSGGNQVWDAPLAQTLVGKTVLIGITYVDASGAILRLKEFHGVIAEADPKKGIRVELAGKSAGQTYWLPPDTRGLHPAAPGEYRLKSTGEIVIDPDFTTEWTSQMPEGK